MTKEQETLDEESVVADVGGFAGPFLFEAAQVAGPVALARARANGRAEPNWQDWAGATGTATVSGLFNMFGIRGVGELNKSVYRTVSSPIRAGAREGITEGFQGLTEQIGSTALTDQGLEIDPKSAVGEAIIGGTTGAAFQAPVSARTLVDQLKQEIEGFNVEPIDPGTQSNLSPVENISPTILPNEKDREIAMRRLGGIGSLV